MSFRLSDPHKIQIFYKALKTINDANDTFYLVITEANVCVFYVQLPQLIITTRTPNNEASYQVTFGQGFFSQYQMTDLGGSGSTEIEQYQFQCTRDSFKGVFSFDGVILNNFTDKGSRTGSNYPARRIFKQFQIVDNQEKIVFHD